MYGSIIERYRAYPQLLEWELDTVYNAEDGLGYMRELMLPRLRRAVIENDPKMFSTWMPFARRFAQKIGYGFD